MKTQCTTEELLEAAVIASMRLKYGYKGYESEEKALKALRRRCSGLAPGRYQQALSEAGELYEAAEKLVVARMGAAPAEDWPDMNAYAEAKTEVIESILAASQAAGEVSR
jgi:uncharacterized protein HemY